MGPIFTPPVVSKWEGPRGTLMHSGSDRRRELAGRLVRSGDQALLHLHQRDDHDAEPAAAGEQQSDMLFGRGVARNPNPAPAPAAGARAGGGGGGGLNVRGLPLIKPPYATITAIDMNKGEQLWRIAHGDTPDNIKNNPALKGLTIPRTGRPGRIGVLTTKTLADRW